MESIQRLPRRSLATLVLALALAAHLHAAVTNVAWYRLGENDPGAANGMAVANSTTDLMAATHLKQFNGPRYTNVVSSGASNRVGSSLAVNFNGVNQFFSNGVISTAIDNFGIEAWVKPNSTDGLSTGIAYNGGSGNGWGLIQSGGEFAANYGGAGAVFVLGPVAPGTWTHLALVRDNGTTRLYYNGAPVGTSTAVPNPPTIGFGIGSRPQPVIAEFFNGTIDEVRVFTFAPGQFRTNDLVFHLQRVSTLPASNVSVNQGTMNASVDPAGLSSRAWMEFGNTTNYFGAGAAASFAGGGLTNFTTSILGGAGGDTWHYRAVISNSLGVAFGANQSFTTPVFSDIGAGLPGANFSSVAWGDYDNDGRLDILLTGQTNDATVLSGISQVWRNTGNGFTNINAGLPSVYNGTAIWGDYDKDGRLDILLTGYHSRNGFSVEPISQILRNTGSGFTNINAGLPPLVGSSAAWGDYDNDGRLDFVLTGAASVDASSSPPISQVWRNAGSGFSDIHAGLPGVFGGSAAWGDYDNDGRLDILLTGRINVGSGGTICQVWRNHGNGFTNIHAGLPGANYAAWGDYDNDGRLDILLTGQDAGISQVWRNTGSGFTNINAGLPGVHSKSVAWGDYDNDGRLDILLAGENSQVWRNTGSGFTNIDAGFPPTQFSSGAWGDYNDDGRLDVVLMGHLVDTFARMTWVWRNHTPYTNTPPNAPSGLNVTLVGQTATFTWNAASDAQTPPTGLTYNLRVGTTPGGTEIVHPVAAASGLLRLPEFGNAQTRHFQPVTVPAGQPVYWSVQAVDTAFAGSPFAAEKSFAFNSVFTPPSGIPVPGDTNGDGVVNQAEFESILANYWPHSPFLRMTNVAGLGGTNVTFSLSNSTAGAFSVEYTTNLVDWYHLGPATPRYLFTDTNAPAVPQRHYRLRWP